LIKGLKDPNSSLVSNENLSEILWFGGWALGQVIWGKMSTNLPHCIRQSQKKHKPKTNNFFHCCLEDFLNLLRVWTAL